MNSIYKFFYLLFISLVIISISFAANSDGCNEFGENECETSDECYWDFDEGECISVEDDEDDEDNYSYESSAEFEFDESDIYYGKIRAKITDTGINKLIFALEHLEAGMGYSVTLGGRWTYSFITSQDGKFDWTMNSDGSGDAPLPEDAVPVSQFNIAQLFNASGELIAAAVFDDDDEGCSDLPQNICEAVPLCAWNSIQGCQENEWDFDDDDGDGVSDDEDEDDDNDGIPDDEDDDDDNDGIPDDEDTINSPWNIGDYFVEEMISNYSDYMDQYNQTGQGLFNYLILNPSRTINSDIGDEIGVLDSGGEQNGQGCDEVFGHQLVGAGIWTGESITIFAFGHISDCNNGGIQYPGFVTGNDIVVRVYKPTTDSYIDYDVQITWGGSQAIYEIVVSSIIGDVNEDGFLNVLDIVIVVDMVLGFSAENQSADINGDSVVNILDVVELINLIIGTN